MHRWFSFRPSKPRSPLLRILVGMLGLGVLLSLVVVFGLFIGLGMLVFAVVRRLSRPVATTVSAKPSARDDSIIDGDYSVVNKSSAHLSLR